VNRNVNQIEDIDMIGKEKEKEINEEIKNGKEFSTPKKLDSFLEFQSVVSATSTSTSTITSNLNPNENMRQKNKKEKKTNSGLEISFHIKEAWNIFEVRKVIMFLYYVVSFFSVLLRINQELFDKA
jgi:hypothetical protein